ncbi:TLDc domain-containing protein [Oxytricha trifallax]|uniref:TLDc domain-containing protein n=1 Tax=Oxytricha trifallax TaxID=1172189 RepID=A0A073HYC0_9SPIT|nr:TLDc domain-containing protein [Oxytricha trifallax]
MNNEVEKLIKSCFQRVKDIQQPQQEHEYKVQDLLHIKRKPIEDITFIISLYQQKVDIEVQKKSNSILKNYIKDWPLLQFKLLYQASADGFDVEIFHEKCDDQGPTVTFYLSDLGKVFGVNSSIIMQSDEEGIHKHDPELFVFQLDKQTIHYSKKPETNTCHFDQYFNSPGNENEMEITNDGEEDEFKILCNSKNFGLSFELPNEIQFGSIQAKNYLGGAESFNINEVEVYSLSK